MSGRTTNKKGETVHICCYVPIEIRDQLNEKVKNEGLSISFLLRKYVYEYLNN